MILAIESGGQFVSVAVGTSKFFSTVTINTPRNSEGLLAAINYLQEIHENKPISKVGVSLGPGSYTGLRVGLSLAQGLAVGLNVPLITVSTFLADIYQTQLQDGDRESKVKLRDGELAVARFALSDNASRVTQIGATSFIYGEDLGLQPTGKGVLLATERISKFIPSDSGDLHYIKSSGKVPIALMYLKPVQAKTLIERGL